MFTMKHLLIILLAISYACAYAQEKAMFRIIYNCDAESFVGKKETYRWTLDVGVKSAIFYNCKYRDYNIELDSLIKSTDVAALLGQMSMLGKKYAGRNSMQVIIGKPENGMYTYVNSSGESLLCYEESVPNIDWQLLDSTKIVCGYDCSMAIGNVYGRTWTVWYSTDIPMTFGPYILGGLPGLIMSASDNNNFFNFEVIGIEQAPTGTLIKFEGLKEVQKCSRKRFLALRKESSELTFKDRAERTRQQLGLDNKNTTIKVVGTDGKEVKADEMIPKRNYLDLE